MTTLEADAIAVPFAVLEDGSPDGLRLDRVLGTYLHGALEDAAVCEELLGVPIAADGAKAEHYRRLAAWFEQNGRGLERLGLG